MPGAEPMKVINYIYVNRSSWNCTQIFNNESEYNNIMEVNKKHHNYIIEGNTTTVYIKG
jgi:hypothetical protein